jgi:hypothetical protein
MPRLTKRQQRQEELAAQGGSSSGDEEQQATGTANVFAAARSQLAVDDTVEDEQDNEEPAPTKAKKVAILFLVGQQHRTQICY